MSSPSLDVLDTDESGYPPPPLFATEDQHAELDLLVQLSLTCAWRPRTQESFNGTMTCSTAMMDLLERIRGRPENDPSISALYFLPADVIEQIFFYALIHDGDPGRSSLQRVCRFFRCILFSRDSLWRDANSYSVVPAAFMIASWRSRWTGIPHRIQLDASTRYREAVPNNALLYSVFTNIASLVIEHQLPNAGVMRMLGRLRTFPNLTELVLRSTTPYPLDPATPRRPYHEYFRFGQPSISAAALRVLHLVSCYALFPDSKRLEDVRLSGRFLHLDYEEDFDDEDEPLEVFVLTKWPSNVLWALLRGQSVLTTLHLIDAVSETRERFCGTLSLPALKELYVRSVTTGEAAWIFETVELPGTTYINVCVGTGAREYDGLNLRELFKSLRRIARSRRFKVLGALSSVFLTGILFSPSVRCPGPPALYLERTPENAFYGLEKCHADYRPASGAIDVYVNWESDFIEEPLWVDFVKAATRYIDLFPLETLEFNSEFSAEFNVGVFPSEELNTAYITGLRFWRDEYLTMLDHLLLVCDGNAVDEDADTVNARAVTDTMRSLFPAVKHVTDARSNKVWRGSTTTRLVEALIRDWDTEHINLRLP